MHAKTSLNEMPDSRGASAKSIYWSGGSLVLFSSYKYCRSFCYRHILATLRYEHKSRKFLWFSLLLGRGASVFVIINLYINTEVRKLSLRTRLHNLCAASAYKSVCHMSINLITRRQKILYYGRYVLTVPWISSRLMSQQSFPLSPKKAWPCWNSSLPPSPCLV